MPPDNSTLVPSGRVLLPLVLAALFEPAAWAWLGWVWFTRPDAAGPGWYGQADLLVGVHLLTVGTLTLSLLGASWQLASVAGARPWPRWTPAPWINAAVLLSLPGFYLGLARPGVGTIAAFALVAALALRAGLLLVQLRGGIRPIVRAWLAAAELCLLAGLVIAGMLWGARAGLWSGLDSYSLVHRHAALLLGGWVGGWVIGIGSLLLPMFALGTEPDPRCMAASGILYFAGIATMNAPLWAAGTLLAIGLLAYSLLRALHRGPSLTQAGAGLTGIAAAVALLPFLPGDQALTVGLVLGLLPLLRGVAQRIVPFFLWNALLARDSSRAPPAASLLSARWVPWQTAASLLGGAGVVAGRLGWSGWGRVGALLALVGAIGHLALLLTAYTRARAARARADIIPGMEVQ